MTVVHDLDVGSRPAATWKTKINHEIVISASEEFSIGIKAGEQRHKMFSLCEK